MAVLHIIGGAGAARYLRLVDSQCNPYSVFIHRMGAVFSLSKLTMRSSTLKGRSVEDNGHHTLFTSWQSAY
jgi:hypothetical protein